MSSDAMTSEDALLVYVLLSRLLAEGPRATGIQLGDTCGAQLTGAIQRVQEHLQTQSLARRAA